MPTFVGVTTNAGKARFRGAELEANWRMANDLAAAGDHLSFAGTLGYLDAKYLHYLTVLNRGPDGAPTAPVEVDVAPYRNIQNTPKWTMSGTLDYDAPLSGGRIDVNTTLAYRSKSQQFESPIPGLDQKGFALWDANVVWRSPGNKFTVGLHGKNLANTRYVVSGYNYILQNPYNGQFITNAGTPATSPSQYVSTLGTEGVLTAFYGNPRQVWLSLGVSF